MNNYFSTNLNFVREQKKMTQEDMAKLFNKNYSTIGKWEKGQRTPTTEEIFRISKKLNIPFEILIGKDLRLKDQINSNEYDEEVKQYYIDKGVTLEIGKNAELTASDVLKIQSEVNKILMDEMHSEDKN